MFYMIQILLSHIKFILSTKRSSFWNGILFNYSGWYDQINYFSKLVANENDVNKIGDSGQQCLETKALVFIDVSLVEKLEYD